MAAPMQEVQLETAEIDREKVFKQLDEQTRIRQRLLDAQSEISEKTSELAKQIELLTEQHTELHEQFSRSIAVTDELNELLNKFADF